MDQNRETRPRPARSFLRKEMLRREALRWIGAAPAAAVASSVLAGSDIDTGFEETETASDGEGLFSRNGKASDTTACILKNEKGLSHKERSRLADGIPSLEDALRTLRDHRLTDDVEPAFVFRALRSPGGRSGGGR